jgi:hypothetical protein
MRDDLEAVFDQHCEEIKHLAGRQRKLVASEAPKNCIASSASRLVASAVDTGAEHRLA